jgi:hypothetical protein
MKYNTYYHRKTNSFPLHENDDEITDYVAKHLTLDMGGDVNTEKDMDMHTCTDTDTDTDRNLEMATRAEYLQTSPTQTVPVY